MSEALILEGLRTLGFEEIPDRALEPHEVRLRTLYSGISAGTELTAYRGSNVYLHKRWDGEQRLFMPGEAPSKQYPVRDLGYEESGEVIEVGSKVRRVKVGDIVCGTWGHRTTHIAAEDYAAGRILSLDLALAARCSAETRGVVMLA